MPIYGLIILETKPFFSTHYQVFNHSFIAHSPNLQFIFNLLRQSTFSCLSPSVVRIEILEHPSPPVGYVTKPLVALTPRPLFALGFRPFFLQFLNDQPQAPTRVLAVTLRIISKFSDVRKGGLQKKIIPPQSELFHPHCS